MSIITTDKSNLDDFYTPTTNMGLRRYAPDPNEAEINDFEGKQIVYINAPELWDMGEIINWEYALNAREYYAHSNIRYRVFPSGVKILNKQEADEYWSKVVVRCVYCGQFGAVKTQCPNCGAPIG